MHQDKTPVTFKKSSFILFPMIGQNNEREFFAIFWRQFIQFLIKAFFDVLFLLFRQFLNELLTREKEYVEKTYKIT